MNNSNSKQARALNGVGPAQYASPRDYLRERIAHREAAQRADWHELARRELDASAMGEELDI